MITLRCTRKLLALLDAAPADCVPETTAALGDWYANVVETVAGDLVVFANEKTLLSVAIPVRISSLLAVEFPKRVYNLLRMIGVPIRIASAECAELESVVLARTANRSVLGSLKEIPLHYQMIAERDAGLGTLSLSNEERVLSRYMHKPLGYERPAEIALRILRNRYGAG